MVQSRLREFSLMLPRFLLDQSCPLRCAVPILFPAHRSRVFKLGFGKRFLIFVFPFRLIENQGYSHRSHQHL